MKLAALVIVASLLAPSLAYAEGDSSSICDDHSLWSYVYEKMKDQGAPTPHRLDPAASKKFLYRSHLHWPSQDDPLPGSATVYVFHTDEGNLAIAVRDKDKCVVQVSPVDDLAMHYLLGRMEWPKDY